MAQVGFQVAHAHDLAAAFSIVENALGALKNRLDDEGYHGTVIAERCAELAGTLRRMAEHARKDAIA